jgi:hypothetical protein
MPSPAAQRLPDDVATAKNSGKLIPDYRILSIEKIE